MLQCLLHLSFVLANVKDDGFDSFNIASNLSLRNNQAVALCNEAGEGGDGNGGALGGRQGDLEEGGRQVEGAVGFPWIPDQDHPH